MKACGGCALCCEVIPVNDADLTKRSFTRCQFMRDALHAAGPGCGIYSSRPHSCRSWACVWLTSPDLPEELRPDRCGVVFDPVVDLVRVDGVEQPAAQVWARPGREMAWQEPLIASAINGLLNQVPFVLWRQRGEGGQQMARAIGRVAGQLHSGPLSKANYDLGTELERFARVDQLMARNAAGKNGGQGR